ncbi:hypothetical protein EYZ11_006287 [Aspergillus tanneri]|uniref:Uncharacterized protein n=1 Tax=Aspergillus tanneri TaxID=1220188 RepID=A0A4S3JFT8_9EURO|nr:hypothetical protein EYZ11_006287 [Aspergillus tanneri]
MASSWLSLSSKMGVRWDRASGCRGTGGIKAE